MADKAKAVLANFTFGNATIITPPNVIRISLAPAGSGGAGPPGGAFEVGRCRSTPG